MRIHIFGRMNLLVCCLLLVAGLIAVHGQVDKPHIYKLHIESDIAYRFATTNVTSYIANPAKEAQEVSFEVSLPDEAFISNFTMIIDGELYLGKVKEKKTAQKQYDKAKSKGQSAGQIKAKPSTVANEFTIEVNVAAESKVEFSLTYQELLKRRLGIYEHVININPNQVVRDLQVKVNIQESRAITYLKVPELRQKYHNSVNAPANPLAVVQRVDEQTAVVTYAPDEATQKKISVNGIAGQFVVQYDVERDFSAGEIQVVDGYFVHYFAPTGLNPIKKNILFVLDKSGSMDGIKLEQVKNAMATILGDLREGDKFNIMEFSSGATTWRPEGMLDINERTIREAQSYMSRMASGGGTNIHAALIEGARFLTKHKVQGNDVHPSLIIFLTDGLPSSGITSTSRIIEQFSEINEGECSLFSLGFGQDVDFDFLTKVSLQNKGFARKIYTNADPTLQLQRFYEEISTPLLADIDIEYLGDSVDPDSVTNTAFPSYFQGTELIVAGRLKDNQVSNVISQVSGESSTGPLSIDLNVNTQSQAEEGLPRFTEKLWAYLTIKKMLEDAKRFDNTTVIEAANQKALALSLKYGFVTPLTSMVITKPENEEPEKLPEPEPVPEDLNLEYDARAYSSISRHRSSSKAHSDPMAIKAPMKIKAYRRPSFVDNDPHFVVNIDGVDESVCFDVNGQPGNVFQLLYDNKNDIVINGEVDAPVERPRDKQHVPTYFSTIAVMHSKVSIHITPRKISFRNKTVNWKAANGRRFGNMQIEVPEKHRMVIRIGKGVEFSVLRHLTRVPNPKKMDYLGFYISNKDKLDRYSHGLIGQFVNGHVKLTETPPNESKKFISSDKSKPPTVTKTLTMKAFDGTVQKVTAFLGQRRNMEIREKVPCWHVRNNGKGLLQGHFNDYLVPSLYHREFVLREKHG